MTKYIALVIAILSLLPLHSFGSERFVYKVRLPSGQIAVVAEGDFEARSLGSFSVRIYEAASNQDETTFFIDGIVTARTGTIEKVVLADIDGNARQEIIVIVRSVGTGGYLSAHAFVCTKNKLIHRATVRDLSPDADPVKVLQKTAN